MNHDNNYINYDNYINEEAKAKGIDPRQVLEDRVLDYKDYITGERRQTIINTYRLRAVSEVDQLKEFVQSKNPYEVIKQCFAPGRLHRLAEEEFKISPDLGLTDHELISIMLYNWGFKNQVKPTTGLFQIPK